MLAERSKRCASPFARKDARRTRPGHHKPWGNGTTGADAAGLRPHEVWRASAAVCHAYRGSGLVIWVGVPAVSDGLCPGYGPKVTRGTFQGEAHWHG
jgi:hypothetical protein